LRELTKRYEHIIKAYGVDEWAPKEFDAKEFMKGLASIQTIPVCQGCLKGGGKTDCEMRNCALSKNVADCVECGQRAACRNIEPLQKVHVGAHDAGMMVKTENVDRKELIEKWTAELKSKCPDCGA